MANVTAWAPSAGLPPLVWPLAAAAPALNVDLGFRMVDHGMEPTLGIVYQCHS